MLSTQQRVEEFGVGGTDVCLPTTIKWQYHGAPLHSIGRAEEFKKSSTWIPDSKPKEFGVGGTDVCFPTTIKWQHRCAPLNSDGRVEEFKKNSTWSTNLGLRHVYLPVCGRKSQMTSSRHITVCLLAKDLMKLLYICTCVFFDLRFFRVRVSLRMWQEM